MRRLDGFVEQMSTQLMIPGESISQTFVSRHNNLSSLRFRLYNPVLGGNGEYRVQIERANGEVIAEQIYKESNVGWGDDVRYDFAPVTESKGQEFRLRITKVGVSPQENEWIGENNQNRLGINHVGAGGEGKEGLEQRNMTWGYSGEDIYPNGQAYLGKEKLPGDMVFQVYYSTGVGGFLKDGLGDLGRRIGADRGFELMYLGVLVVILGMIWWRVKRWWEKA